MEKMIEFNRVDKLKLLIKAKNDLENLIENIDKSYKFSYEDMDYRKEVIIILKEYEIPQYNKYLAENIITTINDVWQRENEIIKIFESCEEEEILKVVTDEEEQTKDSLKEEDLNLLK